MEQKMQNKLAPKYKKLVEQKSSNSHLIRNCFRAFIVGGVICDVGQFISNTFYYYGVNKDLTSSYVAAIMVFLGALLTGIGVYDDIGKYAGAGSIVPITGFANSIVSPAMEFKAEGYILGVGAKMFTIAGPVLVYGISTSVIIGFIYYLLKL